MTTNSVFEQLFNSYATLEFPTRAPIHAYAPALTYARFDDPGSSPRGLQRMMPASFRVELAKAFPATPIALLDPREVAAVHRSDRWAHLCDMLDRFRNLSIEERTVVFAQLLSLGFHRIVLELSAAVPIENSNPDVATLQYQYAVANARYALTNDGEEVGYALSEFELIANRAPEGSRLSVNACIHMLVQNARHAIDIEAATRWTDRAEKALQKFEMNNGAFDTNLIRSRFYRAASFIPFMMDDKDECVRVMELAEEHAHRLEAMDKDLVETILCKENWLPLLQSRSKEARFIGDLPAALERLDRGTKIDPLDAMRWSELGDCQYDMGDVNNALRSFNVAASLSPPGGSYANFMIGQCHEAMGFYVDAENDYLECLSLDPLCISAYEGLISVGKKTGDSALSSWSIKQINELSQNE
ncbi:tetratricopeptide repeat protein [Paraburkholderia strydomiana]